MTRAHVRLLGPCFKTGRVERLHWNHGLWTAEHRDTAAAHRQQETVTFNGVDLEYSEQSSVSAQQPLTNH